MSSSDWSDRLVRGYAFLRGALLVVFSAVLMLAPEKAMPGSSMEPARSLGLMFASRTILLGVAFMVLVLRRRREGLAWVFVADAGLQLFDTGLALAMNKGIVAIAPAVLGAIDLSAGLFLLRAARVSKKV
ncbi:MAG TPA: hypothetical protein VK550_34310 [Polyangiaceae bacterium]|nr:hypothetical protein [Polyangiaceae bacterium]